MDFSCQFSLNEQTVDNMHIYAFGSIWRGEVDASSDIDLLTIVDGRDLRFDAEIFSIYGYSRIKAIWREGNPFAWHLSLESRLLHSSDGVDFLQSIGSPERYQRSATDCAKFRDIFKAASEALRNGSSSPIFELSSVFLAMRNIATCYSLGVLDKPDFSRRSALRLQGDSLEIEDKVFSMIERARILSTRGHGSLLTEDEIEIIKVHLDRIESWMDRLSEKAKAFHHE